MQYEFLRIHTNAKKQIEFWKEIGFPLYLILSLKILKFPNQNENHLLPLYQLSKFGIKDALTGA